MADTTAEHALERARELVGTSNLAHAVGVSPQAVAQWKVVPATRVLAVEKATGVSRFALRPDVFGSDDQ